jgi:GTP-binding protein
MKVTDARFIKSVYHLPDLPKPLLPELAFSGRSNVGKSSLINVLLNRKGFAKTSSTPGRTQSINFMEINSSFYFVDLPGYGYANVPLAVRKKWQPLIEGYLAQRTTLRLLVLLADIRREPQEDEELFVAWLKQLDIPLLVVLTKIDKVKKNSQVASLRQWQRRLDIDEKIVLFSAVTGEGKEKIWRYLDLSLRAVK